GEGIQHQDGHSQVIAGTVPNLKSYDPAFAYELVVIVREGIRRMYQEQEDLFYYLTAYNENYAMPPMPAIDGIEEGILAGAYCYEPAEKGAGTPIHLLGSGAIMQQALSARDRLTELGFAVSVWSVTSYNELYRDAEACDRHNRLHPTGKQDVSCVQRLFGDCEGVIVAASDYMKALPNAIARWMPADYYVLGTDGYGLSESRVDLRRYFEVSGDHICHTALVGLYRRGDLSAARLKKLTATLDVAKDKPDPMQH
ncbi:MAG: pyruvate dehydrogenase (acetyl-transferring), homodimeric type, partial [Pseudohongiellaceae bacterium]